MSEPDMPILLALYEPDIAQNAGAMMRTCACLGVDAAVIEPAGGAVPPSGRVRLKAKAITSPATNNAPR